MDILSMFIIVVLSVWFVLGMVFIYKKRGKGCGSCGINCAGCMGCSQRKEYEKTYRKKDKK